MLQYWHQVVEKVLETVASPLKYYDNTRITDELTQQLYKFTVIGL